MTPMALFVDQPWNLSPSVITVMALFGLASFSTSLAYIIYFRVLATAGPTNVLLVTFLIPLSAILLGVMVLGERLKWNSFAGLGLIFIGLVAIDSRLIERFTDKQEVCNYEI
jgi:drug/metabolite transporter (DMT)-like permease